MCAAKQLFEVLLKYRDEYTKTRLSADGALERWQLDGAKAEQHTKWKAEAARIKDIKSKKERNEATKKLRQEQKQVLAEQEKQRKDKAQQKRQQKEQEKLMAEQLKKSEQ